MDFLSLNIRKAFQRIHCINELYNKRLKEKKMDIELCKQTFMEWIRMLQNYISVLIGLIDALYSKAESRESDSCSKSFLDKTPNCSEAEKRLHLLQSEEKSYIDILNREVLALVEICCFHNKQMKLKERQFSCQKEKIVKLVKSLMIRITTGQQKLSKFTKDIISVKNLLSEHSQEYESDCNIIQNLRSKVIQMKTENKNLKEQILQAKSASSTTDCRLQEENTSLQKQLEEMDSKRAAFEEKFLEESERVTLMFKQNFNLVRTLKTLEDDFQNLSQNLCEKEEEIRVLKETLSDRSSDYNNSKMMEVLKTYDESAETLKQSLKELGKINTAANEEAICTLEKMVADRDMTIDDLEDTLETKRKQISSLKENLSNVERELDASMEELEIVKDNICKSRVLIEKTTDDSADSGNFSFKSTITDLKKTNETLQLRVTNFEDTTQRMKEEIGVLKDKLKNQVIKSNDTVCKFDQLVEDYNEILKDHSNTVHELEKAATIIESYQEKYASKEKQILDLQKTLECAANSDKAQLLALNCELQRINNVFSGENEFLIGENSSLGKRIRALQRKLDQCCCNS